MTPDRKAELIIKRHNEATRKNRLAKYVRFQDLVSPLALKNIRYLVAPLDLEFDSLHSVNSIWDGFEFSESGHLCSEESPEKSVNWNRLINFKEYKNDWVYLIWKGEAYSISLRLSDLLPFVENLCIDYHWDSYVFNPASGWIVEFHHDGWVSYQPSLRV